ncbi:peptidoglycan DD-metalloendopeptidase family protein [Chlorogloeopsis sp. ULAP02]|uniref:peptidoglycan DD-metalloendopeptidase family protein n=1 Tax=Chlorogloeopsis sp. ULAP02 TaxID=3107926 RepID=UPI003134B743
MKRALKKKEKAVLENAQSEDVPVEHQNVVNPRNHHRVPTKAAMIGLAISMGATSLLVTRQSDRALAAEPVGNQNTASTIPALAESEVKLASATRWESKTASLTGKPENPVFVEPKAASQVPGFGAQWQPVQVTAPLAVKQGASSENANAQTVKKQLQTVEKLSRAYGVDANQTTLPAVQPQILTTTDAVSSEVNAQLKAQQEFALYRLQEKSNRLRASLTQLRSNQTQGFSQIAANTVPSASALENSSQDNTSNTFTLQSETDSKKANLISKLKRATATNLSNSATAPAAVVPTLTTPTLESTVASPIPATPVLEPTAASPTLVALSTTAKYKVKRGDTLAAIARAYGTSISELVKANNLTDPNQLLVDQKLIIPQIPVKNTSTQTAVTPYSPTFNWNSTSKVVNTNTSSVIANKNVPMIGVWQQTSSQISMNPEPTPTNVAAPVVINTSNTAGIGGDTPLPKVTNQTRLAKQEDSTTITNTKSNQGLRSLQAEIEKLRAKYRSQQSGNSTVTENTTDTAAFQSSPSKPSENLSVPIPVATPNHVAAPLIQRSVSIPVPQVRASNQPEPIKPSFRATQPTNEPINPEFQSNRGTKVATPSVDVDASRSLGVRRGTKVSPELPPLASVDIYLPKPIEEITPTSTGYIWPTKGVLTSGYGWRWGRMHKGIDIANGTGTQIVAAAAGVVEKAGWNPGGYGNLVDIRHGDGTLTRYAHNSKVLVRAGQQVQQGQPISLMGSTGFSTGPHLHFEVHSSGKGAVNPIAYLPQERL